MAVQLVKSTGLPDAWKRTEAARGPDVEGFRAHLEKRTFDGYCDAATWRLLVEHGTRVCSLDEKGAGVAVDMELETRSVANELALLSEMGAVLRQFSEKDKKLDAKERSDAIQYVCRPKPGYSKGLRYDVAEAFVTDFCRQNGVKVKVGIFKWAVP